MTHEPMISIDDQPQLKLIVNKGWLHYGVVAIRNSAIYLGVGAWCHVWFVGPGAPSGLLSWAWILAWPLGLAVISAKWAAIIVAGFVLLALAATLVWVVIVMVRGHLMRRRVAKMRRDIDRGLHGVRAGTDA